MIMDFKILGKNKLKSLQPTKIHTKGIKYKISS